MCDKCFEGNSYRERRVPTEMVEERIGHLNRVVREG